MLDFLYHDDALVALAKPAGRIVVPGRGAAASERTLREDVAAELGRDVFVVHRLDRGTSGVLLFAVTAEAHRALSMAFERHQIDKRYWGLCRGTLVGSGEVDRALVPIRGGRVRPARPGESGGKPSVTAWRAIERFARSGEGGRGGEGSGGGEGGASGARGPWRRRAHWRRAGVHLASSCARVPAACIRCVPTSRSSATPWPSTPTTAAPSACSPATSIRSLEAPAGDELVLSRVPLHAERVRFRHPTTGKPVEIAAPLPPDLERVVALLRR